MNELEVISLAEALPREMARVREVLAIYQSLGPNGRWGAAMIEKDLAQADQVTAAGDTVGMLRSYEALRQIE